MKKNTKNQIDQAILGHSLKKLATQLDLCAQHFAEISHQIDDLSFNVCNANHVPTCVADSCLLLLREISASGMANVKETFTGNAATGIVTSCINIKGDIKDFRLTPPQL